MTITIFTSEHCLPCKEVEHLIKEGRFSDDDIEIIDIETDDGFNLFKKEVLEFGDAAVPSAYKDGQACIIKIDRDDRRLIIECPPASPPASDQQI